LWAISGQAFPQLLAFDAVSLQLLYSTNQALNKRDTLPPLGHFATQTVANGKVYVATQNSLEIYGLFHVAAITGGSAQSATVATPLPAPIQVQAYNPYTGQPDVGATVNFSDGGKGGSFNPASAITDSSGNVSTTYTVPKKSGTYTLAISGSGFGNVTTTATAKPGAAIKIISYGGSKQTGPAGSNLANPLVAQAQDVYKNGVPGITVQFAANKGAIPVPSSTVTDATGLARTILQLPTTVATVTVTASSAGFKNITYVEYSVAGPAANIAITGGNNQSAPAGTQLPQALTVLVADQYGNPVSGNSVAFSDGGAGGSFSNSNPVATGANGTATQFYTLPPSPGTVTINATAAGVPAPAVFTETGH
jgi:adhesin/invasin